MEHSLFVAADLLGTFAFAVSGAVASEQRHLDVFGVLAIAFVTACGGGIVRDVCIGAVPPAGMADWRYLACAAIAAAIAMWARKVIDLIRHPVLFFDSLGLGFFAVVGAHKTLQFHDNVELAAMLGVVTAVGGGVLRDVLLNRVPVILQKEIYAVAALAGAASQVAGEKMDWSLATTPWFATAICFAIRFMALRYSWSLPVPNREDGA